MAEFKAEQNENLMLTVIRGSGRLALLLRISF